MSSIRDRQAADSISTLRRHVVWCPTCWRPVLGDAMTARLVDLLHERAVALGCVVKRLTVLPDHVRLVITAPPTHAPQYLANQFKGVTARRLRQAFPSLRSRLPSLWSRSYDVGAAGTVSEATGRRYVAAQRGQ